MPALRERIEDLPLKLPVKDFKNRYTRIYFYSPTLNKNIFSMEMDGSLLDKPRPIRLLLNCPKASLRTTWDWSRVRFTARVSNRMRYMDLPYWDKSARKLVPMPRPPMLKYKIGNQPEREIEMRDFCYGFKWFALLPYDENKPNSDTTIRYRIKYDLGGAFKPIRARFEYDYRADRH